MDPPRVTLADTADHYPPWTCWREFAAGPLRSTCAAHNRVGPFAKAREYSAAIDPASGYPVDSRHPFNRGAV
jgi:hypothetical protein